MRTLLARTPDPVPVTTPEATTLTTPPALAPSPQPTAVQLVTAVAARMLSAVLTPFAGTGPNTPAADPGIWTLLGFARRELGDDTTESDPAPVAQRLTAQALTTTTTLAAAAPAGPAAPEFSTVGTAVPIVIGPIVIRFNQPPTAAPKITAVDPVTGVVTGALNAKDPNNDPLTYSVATAPARGTLTVSPTGTFIYTPTRAARDQALATPGYDYDQFALRISDGRGGTTLVTAKNIPVTPTNRPPAATAAPTVGTPDPRTGKVTGNLNVTDPDGNPLTYTVTTAPTKGAVTIASNGTYTYTPTPQARLAAYSAGQSGSTAPQARTALAAAAAPAPTTDAFTATASDGRGGTTSVTVADIPVAPAEAVTTNTVKVGAGPQGIAVSPDGTHIYVANDFDGTVSVIDPVTNRVGTPITVAGLPRGVAFSPDSTRAYVTLNGQVAVINTATNTVIKTVTVPGGLHQGLAVSPDGKQVYVSSLTQGQTTVNVIDTNTNTVSGPAIAIGGATSDIVFTPDGRKAYISGAAGSNNNVAVVDTTTRTVITQIPVGPGQQALAINPAGTRVYVARGYGLAVIDTASNTVLTDLGADASGAFDVAVNPSGTRAYVTNSGNAVYVVDTATNRVVDRAEATTSYNVAVAPDGLHAYVTNLNQGTVSVLTLASNRPPTGSAAATAPDFVTGAVTVTVTASDPDGDALTYGVGSGPAGGTLTPTATPGTFTYTPNDAARTRAEGTPGPDTDTFTLSVTDSRGASTAVPVTVTVAPALIVNRTVTLPGAYQWYQVGPDQTRMAVSTVDTDPATGAVSTRIAVIDIASGSRVGPDVVLPGGIRYNYPLVTPDGRRAVFTGTANPNTTTATTVVAVVDTATGAQIGSTVVLAGALDDTTALTADASRVVVTTATRTGPPSSTVAIIDTASGREIGTPVTVAGTVAGSGNIGFGDGPGVIQSGLAVTPDGRRVIVLATDDTAYSATVPATSRLVVVDTTTGAQIGTTLVLRGTGGTQLNADGSRALAVTAHYYSQNGIPLNEASQIAVIDTATGTQLGHTVDVARSAAAQITPDGTRYVTSWFSRPEGTVISVYDAATGDRVGTPFTTIDADHGAAAAVYGNRVVITETGGLYDPLTISVLDATTGTRIGTSTQTVGTTYLYGFRRVTAQNRLLDVRYQYNQPGGANTTTLTVIDLTTGTPVTQTVLDGRLYDSRISGNRAVLALTSTPAGSTTPVTDVVVVDTDAGTPVGTTTRLTGARNYSGPLTLTPDGTRALAIADDTTARSSSLALIDLATGNRIGSGATVPGEDLYRFSRVFSPDRSRITVATYDNISGANYLSVLDTVTGNLIGAPIPVPGESYTSATFRADGRRVIASVESVDDVYGVSTTDTVIDTTTGTVVGQQITFPGSDSQYNVDANAPGPRAVEYGVYSTDRWRTSITLVDTATGTRLGDTVNLVGSQLESLHRPGDGYGTVLGVDIDETADTTTFNITHVQTG